MAELKKVNKKGVRDLNKIKEEQAAEEEKKELERAKKEAIKKYERQERAPEARESRNYWDKTYEQRFKSTIWEFPFLIFFAVILGVKAGKLSLASAIIGLLGIICGILALFNYSMWQNREKVKKRDIEEAAEKEAKKKLEQKTKAREAKGKKK